LQVVPQTGHTYWVTTVAISPDGKYVVTGSGDQTAILWESSSGKKLRTFQGHASWIKGVAMSGNCVYLVTGSADRTAILWETTSGKKLRTFQGHAIEDQQ
jgi:WD40 repeat protein